MSTGSEGDGWMERRKRCMMRARDDGGGTIAKTATRVCRLRLDMRQTVLSVCRSTPDVGRLHRLMAPSPAYKRTSPLGLCLEYSASGVDGAVECRGVYARAGPR